MASRGSETADYACSRAGPTRHAILIDPADHATFEAFSAAVEREWLAAWERAYALRAAAERETLEELSLDLTHGRPIGRISDVLGHAESIRVSAYVYAVEGDPELVPNYEIREAFWSPLDHSNDPERPYVGRLPRLAHKCLGWHVAQRPCERLGVCLEVGLAG